LRWGVIQFWGPMVLVLVASSRSLQRLLYSGNVDGLNVMLLCAFAVAVMRRWDRAAGALWAGVILVKLMPVLFLLPLAGLRRWRTLAVGLGCLAVYVMLLFATGWAAVEGTLYTRVLPHLPYTWHHISVGFHTTLAGMIWGWDWMTPEGYRLWVLGLNLVLVGGLVGLCWWRRAVLVDSPARMLVLSFQCILAFSPLLELIHLAWALPALFLGLRLGVAGEVRGEPFALWLISWLLILSVEVTAPLLSHQIKGWDAHGITTVALAAWMATGVWLALSSPPTAPGAAAAIADPPTEAATG
jgi:hypothetical protein